jgi:hypothetical protein
VKDLTRQKQPRDSTIQDENGSHKQVTLQKDGLSIVRNSTTIHPQETQRCLKFQTPQIIMISQLSQKMWSQQYEQRRIERQ